MYSFEGFLTWIVAAVVGVVTSILQDALKGRVDVTWLDQRVVAVVLSALAGGVALLVEVTLGYDLFSDITNAQDVFLFVLQVLSANQIYHGFTRK